MFIANAIGIGQKKSGGLSGIVTLNAQNQGVVIIFGDSMGGTTSIRPWQSGFDPQHPVPIDNALYEFTFNDVVVEVTSDLVGGMHAPDTYDANSQSQWPKYGNDLYTRTGIKPVFLKCNIGGAEFKQNGDDNNLEASPTGRNFDLMTGAWERCAPVVGVNMPLYIHILCGINDAAAAQSLTAIRPTIVSLINRLIAYFGPEVQIRFTGTGTSGPTPARTRIIALRNFVNDAIKRCDNPNVQFAVDVSGYQALGYYDDGVNPGHDGIHWTQGGNNQWGEDAVLYEITPRFETNILENLFPKFSSTNASGTTLSFDLLANYKIDSTATVFWAVYPQADANHTTGEIAAGTGAAAFGTKVTDCNVTETVNITGLSNNTRYRVQMYATIGDVTTPIYRTITFRTRTSGNDPLTDTMLARYSALDATWITNFTLFYEDALDYEIEAGCDDIWFNGHNSTADKYISMKGILNPVNLGSGPAFTANQGLRTTLVTGDNRLNLQVNDFDFPQYLSNDGFYAINYFADDNGISSGTFRAGFGNVQSTNRCTRFGVTYNSASNKAITFAISDSNNTHDLTTGSSNLELNKLHIVSKGPTQSSTLDCEILVDGVCYFVDASPNVTAANTADWYMFCQNNNGTISARSANGINFLVVGGLSLVNREFLTLATRRLGIGV